MASSLVVRSIGGCSSSGNRTTVYSASVVLIIVFTTAMCLNSITAQRVNCRKYVFAPICRGTASKRAILPPIPYSDENDLYPIQDGKTEMMEVENPVGSLHESGSRKNTIREILQRQRRLYQQPKSDSFDSSLYDY